MKFPKFELCFFAFSFLLFHSCVFLQPTPPDHFSLFYDSSSEEVVLQWDPDLIADRYLIYRGLSLSTNSFRFIAVSKENEYRDSYPLSGTLFYVIQTQSFFSKGDFSQVLTIYVPDSRSLHSPILLKEGEFSNSCIASSGTAWFKIAVSNQGVYQINWKDQAYFNAYVDILVSLYQDPENLPLSTFSQIDYDPIVYSSDYTGFLFLKVETFSIADYGYFEIGYFHLSN